jgi:hypothetical protein
VSGKVKAKQVKEAPRPEHRKLAAVKDKSQTCGEFLDWLEEQGIFLCTHQAGHNWPTHYNENRTEMLARFFEIDLKELEREKVNLLDEIRAANGLK